MKFQNMLCGMALAIAGLGTTFDMRTSLAGNTEQGELATELARLVFPEAKIRARIRQITPSDHRDAHDMAMSFFKYSRVVAEIAGNYTSLFSATELQSILAFQKTPAGKGFQQATEKGFGTEPPPRVPESPPNDTNATRLAEAEKLAAIVLEKELMLAGIRAVIDELAEGSEEKKRNILAEVDQMYSDPVKVRQLRSVKAREFVEALTTDQLKQIVAFYATPTGKKLLKNNVRIGKHAMDAIGREISRAANAF